MSGSWTTLEASEWHALGFEEALAVAEDDRNRGRIGDRDVVRREAQELAWGARGQMARGQSCSSGVEKRREDAPYWA